MKKKEIKENKLFELISLSLCMHSEFLKGNKNTELNFPVTK